MPSIPQPHHQGITSAELGAVSGTIGAGAADCCEGAIMSTTKYVATTIVDLPFIVADAMLSILLEGLPPFKHHWVPMSSGSSYHVLRHHEIDALVFNLFAISLGQAQLIVLLPFGDLLGDASESGLLPKLQNFAQSIGQTLIQHARVRRGEAVSEKDPATHAQMIRELTKAIPEPKRRGPPPEPYTVWARQQARDGVTIDEMLDEYMERRGEDPNDPEQRARSREVLRKTLARTS
jgi:hypothetical protein